MQAAERIGHQQPFVLFTIATLGNLVHTSIVASTLKLYVVLQIILNIQINI